jgi:hypothetical protein
MIELTFDRVEDGCLICVDESGDEYCLPINEAVSRAVRLTVSGEAPEVAVQIPELLRPKDIQALIRAGADPAELVRVSGLSQEHVERYAAPVFDEREFVALRGRSFTLTHEGDAPSLEDLARERLVERGIDPVALNWDAVRQPHGWVLRLDFETEDGPSRARWRIDMNDRALMALNEQAQWIAAGSEPDSPIPPMRLLSAVPGPDGEGYLEEGDLAGESESLGSPLSLLDGLMDSRGLRDPVEFGLDDDPLGLPADVLELRQATEEEAPRDTDVPLEDPSARPYATGPRPSGVFDDASSWSEPPLVAAPTWDNAGIQGQEQTPERVSVWDRPTPGSGAEQAGLGDPPQGELFDAAGVDEYQEPYLAEEPPSQEPSPVRRSSRSHARRSSVPSWDEIVFGSARTDPEDEG